MPENNNYAYSLLGGHPLSRLSGQPGPNSITGEVLRAQYLTLTDELVAEAEATYRQKKDKEESHKFIFLDKSARPVSYIFRGIWKAMHPAADMPEPAHGFLHGRY